MKSDVQPVWSFSHWKFLVILFFAYFSQYFSRVAVDLLAPSLSADKEMDSSSGFSVSDIFAYAMFAYSVGKFFGGPLADAIGGKNLMMIALGAIGIGNFCLARTNDLKSFVIVWSVARFFHAFCHPSVTRLCKAWFNNNNFSTAYSILMAAPIFGSVSASFFLGPVLVSSYGWRGCMLIAALLVFTMLSMLAVFLKREPPQSLVVKSTPSENSTPKPRGQSDPDEAIIKTITTKKALIMFAKTPRYWLCLFGACFTTVLYEFQSLLPLFLYEKHNLDVQTTSMMVSAFSIGGVLSLLSFGSVYDKMSPKTRWVAVLVMLLAGCACLQFLTTVHYTPLLIVLIFLYACCIAPIYNLVPSMFASDLAGEHFIGTIFSSLDVPSYLSAMVFFKCYPWLIAAGQWDLVIHTLMGVALLALAACVALLYLESKSPSPVFWKKLI